MNHSWYLMLDLPANLLQTLVLLFVTIYGLSRWFACSTYKLKRIPCVGSSGVFQSYVEALGFAKNFQVMVEKGYKEYYGTAFKVPSMSKWMVVVSGAQMVDDIRRATDDQLSFREAAADMTQLDYMVGPAIRREPFHVAVVRTPLTRNLGFRFADIKDEISHAFEGLVPLNDQEWLTIPAVPTIAKLICRTSNRLFVDLPLCRNPEYISLIERFTLDVVEGSETINLFPGFLRPLVGRWLTKVPTNIKRIGQFLGPILQERLDQEAKHGPDWTGKPNDLLSWLIDEAQSHQRTIPAILTRVLNVNLAALHTTSMAFAHALYDLCAYPQYIAPLREEVEAVIEAEGWTKASMGNMHKVDSFLKESQRLASGAVLMNRKVLKDFTFSNGVTVPAGTFLAVATRPTHLDETHYKNPDLFDGFRFSNMRNGEGENTKHQTVSLTPEYIIFGNGRHACPGRFFAVSELKAMIAYVLLNYDVQFPIGCSRPPNFWHFGTCAPNPTAEVMFRKRAS